MDSPIKETMIIVLKNYDDRYLEIDREYQRKKVIARYRYLRNFKQSELNLDDRLFLENFAAAMHYLWRVQNPAAIPPVNTIPIPTQGNQAASRSH
jgi:hypothetical protein